MDHLFQLLSHFDILLFLTAITFFTIATLGKIGIPKILPVMSLVMWQRVIFGALSFVCLSAVMIPLLPTRISFAQKLLEDYDGQIVAIPEKAENGSVLCEKPLPEVPTGKKALLLVTARGFSSYRKTENTGLVLPTLHIVLKLDDQDIGAARSSWSYYVGGVSMNPTISTSVILTPGLHKLQIVREHAHDVTVRGTQLRYQIIELD